MPTITGNINNGADDGVAVNTSNAVWNTPDFLLLSQGGPSPSYRSGAWFRITGITVPLNSTITSATLKTYCRSTNPTAAFVLAVDNRSAPGNPTTALQVISPANIVGTLIGSAPHTVPTPTLGKNDFGLTQTNVTSFVQSLVNTYNYLNGEMIFYWNYSSFKIYVYQKNWGSTKAATLEIIYSSEPTLIPKTVYRFL